MPLFFRHILLTLITAGFLGSASIAIAKDSRDGGGDGSGSSSDSSSDDDGDDSGDDDSGDDDDDSNSGSGSLSSGGGSTIFSNSGSGSSSSGRRNHDDARNALRSGKVRKLSEVLAAVHRAQDGDVMKVSLLQQNGSYIYVFRILTPEQELKKLRINASTLVVLDIY
jgi:uncharacterized membrane protein YkoI